VNKKQRYKCKDCGKRFITEYTYNACKIDINQQIITLTKESVGIRGTARILKIFTTTLLKRIVNIAKSIEKPAIPFGRTYEVDEMRTFVGSKNSLIWIVYALERNTKQVVDFNVGARTNKTLRQVITTLELASAKHIYTDKLKNYFYIINKEIHRTALFQTNHIERNNFTIRTHLKRLSRKTICFTLYILLLTYVLQIYFWG
jgi:IS1 family transposase